MFTLRNGSHSQAELEVKRSRFVAYVTGVESEAQARETIERQRRLYPDARHHCSAFVLASAGATARMRSSDDGEPSGTAGAPILEVLVGHELLNVVAVVTRYFGGTLLGTGGLVRAYSQATQLAVASAQMARIETHATFTITCPPTDAGKLEAEMRRAGWTIEEVHWDKVVTTLLSLPATQRQRVRPLVAEVTRGRGLVEEGPDLTVAVAL